MKDNYLISVIGTQIIDGSRDSIEVTTAGDYQIIGNKRYIKYKEYDPDNAEISYLSTVKVEEDGTVTVIRSGPAESRLILQKGKRHQCHYSTAYGSLIVGVYTDSLEDKLTPRGGTLKVSYELDFNAGLVSKNEIYIKVTEKEVN
ncbi:MAG: DUF1934 domain-containing protein [Ruminococcus sp.]